MRSTLNGFRDLIAGGKTPCLPAGLRIYAIGDIHGRLDLLDELLAKTRADMAQRPIIRSVHVFLGDYIDRGRSSRETIDRLIEHGETFESIFLKGNHEWMALKCLSDPALFEQWMRLGGFETLRSYAAVSQPQACETPTAELQSAFHQALPQAHLRFFRDLQISFVCGDFIFVHAGLKPNVNLAQQNERDLLWIRDEFLSCHQDFGKIVVHGHTPTSGVEVRSNRINVDTGAFATGRLSCLVIEDGSLAVIDTLS